MNDETNKAALGETELADPAERRENPADTGPERTTSSQPDDASDGPPEEITLEEFQNLKAKAAKADEHWSQMMRVAADFENYKKRAARERQDAIKFANESLLERLIPVLDNFEMALQVAGDAKAGNTDALKTGVNMIHSQLKTVMNEAGLEEIEAKDRPFDPNLHEAVSQQETAAVAEGHVLQQLRRGYKLRDRLIRPASVVVARKPEKSA